MNIRDAAKHGSALIMVALAALPCGLKAQSATHSMLNGMRSTNQLNEMLNGMTAREANKSQQLGSAPSARIIRQYDGSYLFGPYRITCPADWALRFLANEGSITYVFSSPNHPGSMLFLNQYSVSRFVTIDEFARQQLEALHAVDPVKSWQQHPLGPFGMAVEQLVDLENGSLSFSFLSKVMDSSYAFRSVLPANRTAEDVRAIVNILSTIAPAGQ
jgi:hypothetical protein